MPSGVYQHNLNQGFQEGHKFNLGNTWNVGRQFTEEHRKHLSEAQMGNKYSVGRVVSIETRRKQSDANKGENSYLWRGGITLFHKAIRQSLKYRLWREVVFLRDDWTCQLCGKTGGELQVDHIKPFARFPELRFAIDNGRTLCVGCHRATNTWGKR